MADKLMYIPNDDKQNFPFFTLQLVVEKSGHFTGFFNFQRYKSI